MVKILVDSWEEKIETDAIVLKDCIIIMTNQCIFPDHLLSVYKELKDIDEAMISGNYFFRTSDDFQRGLIIGKILAKYPSITIYTSRIEIIAKYFGNNMVQIEQWPKRIANIIGKDEITLMGDPSPQFPNFQIMLNPSDKKFELPSIFENKNIPKAPEPSQNINYVDPISPPKNSRIFKPESKDNASTPSKFLEERPNPILSLNKNTENYNQKIIIPSNPYNLGPLNSYNKPIQPAREVIELKNSRIEEKKNLNQAREYSSQIEQKVDDNSEIIKSSLASVVDLALQHDQFFQVKTLKDLYGIVFSIVRDLENSELIENDYIRFRLINLAQKMILEYGFFSLNKGYCIADIVDRNLWSTSLILNNS